MLAGLRLRAGLNSARSKPVRSLVALAFIVLATWGIYELVIAGIRLLDNFPAIGTIADAVVRRSLDTLFLVLMAGVAFSSVTGAISTLYYSEDLQFLLVQPVPAWRVFTLKLAETFLTSALIPAFLTVPVLMAVGSSRGESWAYMPLAIITVLALYAIPVAAGSLLALALMRISPAGRVREVATAVTVVLAAGLVLGLRLLRPEQLAAMSEGEFEVLLTRFAALEIGWSPASWAASSVWAALSGTITAGTVLLLAVAAAVLLLTSWLAAVAYRAGWIRALDTARLRVELTVRGPAWWERLLPGRTGALMAKDTRLLLRDPGQWSQLFVLAALAGVYLTGISSLEVDIRQFRDALGAMNLVFIGFMLAGVGMRLAFPLVSLEGEAFWMLKTSPLTGWQIVSAKFLHALPPILLLGGGLGVAIALLVDMSPALRFMAPVAGVASSVAVTALGVGIGAVRPRFDAVNPNEIPVSGGGLMYMGTAFGYSVLQMLLIVVPTQRSLTGQSSAYWTSGEGLLVMAVLIAGTAAVSLLALLLGARSLSLREAGGSS